MEKGPTWPEISSPAHLLDHSSPSVGWKAGPSTICPIQLIFLVLICVVLGVQGDRSNRIRYILSGPPLLGPLLALWWAGGLAQQNYTPSNRLHLFQYTLLSVFMEVGPTGQDISSPAHVTNHSYPYRLAQRTGPPYYNTIYPIQSILLVSIYVILGFHGDWSNRTRYILSGPLSARWWDVG